MATKITMPRLGESVVEGTISTWLKGEGDQVEQFEPILEIETDKVTTEATAEVAGTLLKILVPEGETVPVGTVLALIGEAGEETGDIESVTVKAAEKQEEPEQEEGQTAVMSPPVTRATSTNGPSGAGRSYQGRISPVVGRIAGEHDVDLNLVPGTGRDGRITKKDILAYIEDRDKGPAYPATVPLGDEKELQRRPGVVPGETIPLTGIRRSIAEHMVRSKRTSPHVTTVFEVDFTAVARHRSANKERFTDDGVRLTFTAYIVSAIVHSLQSHPMVNSSWSDEGIIVKRDINIGVAAAVPEGLIVPVVKHADGLSLLGLARAINDLSERARMGKLSPDEVQGGTFTLTNHGVSGSLFATPIINQPQCAILGIGKIEKRVKVINDALAIRPLAYATLTFDHRILDGASGDGFMSTFKDRLETWS